MKKLPEEINTRKFILKQYARKNKYAIFEKWLKEEHVVCRAKGDPPEGDVLIGFEVIQIRRKKAYELFGKQYPAKEAYPSNEEWGLYGFTYNSFRNANFKFRELTGYEKLGVRQRRGECIQSKVVEKYG